MAIIRLFVLFLLGVLPTILPAQITDNFSDGDFTNSPSWSGDATEYSINTGFQLQLNGISSDTSSLSFASPFLANTEWNFWVRENFAPSDNNNVRIYLVSDLAFLEGPINGYYIRMGENGSFDSVDLWEQSGNTHTKIIDGINAHCAATNNVIRIKVTRDATGNWSLFSDITGGYNYQPEGTVFNNTHSFSNFFGVFSKYTLTNNTDFYFDDFYVGPIIVDVTAPTIIAAAAISSTQLDVTFSEGVELSSSQTTTNYSVNLGIGNPSVAVRDAVNLSLVHLTFTTPFISATTYTLSIINVQDLNTNVITLGTTPFSYFPISIPAYHDVRINEIFPDPSPIIGLPNAEFVEIYNTSANNFDLTGWTFTDGSSTGMFPTYILPAGAYLILCSSSDTALFSSFGSVLGISAWPSLNNSGDPLKLFDTGSNIIDSAHYDLTWYHDLIKQDGGWSLELINPTSLVGCAPGGNWIASTNIIGGTPGVVNSVFNNSPDVTGPVLQSVSAIDSLHVELCFDESIDPALLSNVLSYLISPTILNPISLSYDTATLRCVTLVLGTSLMNNSNYQVVFSTLADCYGNVAAPDTGNFSYHLLQPYDVVINEVMADPDPPIQLPNEEYTELYNRTAYDIKLLNWTITVGSTTRALPTIILPADSFIVLTPTASAPLFTGINVVGVTSFPALTNTGGTIILRNQNGMVVHSISYLDSWYQNAAKSDGGWSIEQIDPLNPCGGNHNWKASNSNLGGTPGNKNSVDALNSDVVNPHLIRVSVLAPDSIRLYFSEPLDSSTMSNFLLYTIDNSIGNPISVTPISPAFSNCDLKLATSIVPGIIYSITANVLISDCVGNPLAVPNSAFFALPEGALPGELLINEILFDPIDGGTDFVEIYNNSNKVLDLKNILLCSEDTLLNTLTELNIVAPDGYLLFPKQYLVLSEGSLAVQMQYPISTNIEHCLEMSNIPSMNISGDLVVLADTGFHILDRLVYLPTWHFPLLQNTKGVSLERIDFNRNTQDATNWHSASENCGYGTPTKQNSQFNAGGEGEGEVEIVQQIFSPDGDGNNDVVNIDYNFTEPGLVASIIIFDARGRLVRNLIHSELLGTESGTFSWDGIMDDRTKARVGAYIIYFETFSVDGKVKKYKRSCVLAAKF